MEVTNNTNIEINPSFESFFLDPLVYGTFSILTFCGSSLIFTIFGRYKKLRTITGYLMVIITLIDTATATFVLTPSIYTTIRGEVPWDGTIFCSIQAYCNMLLQNFKATLIMLCALERAVSLLWPFWYQRVATKRLLAAFIVFIFGFSLIIPCYVWGYMRWPGASVGTPQCWPHVIDEGAFYVYWASIALDLIIPGIIVVLCYGTIVVIVIQQRNLIKEQKRSLSSSCGQTRTCEEIEGLDESKNSKTPARFTLIRNNNFTRSGLDWIQHLAACRMLFLVTVLYFMAHVPIHIANFFFDDNATLRTICDYLAYVSTWSNFFIYYNTDTFFKTSAKEFICLRVRSQQGNVKICNHFTTASAVWTVDNYERM